MKATVLALLATSSARVIRDVHTEKPPSVPEYDFINHRYVTPTTMHWNEDYHTMPDPVSGKAYLTSTQAKYLRSEQTDLASEPKGTDPQFFNQYNKDSIEPTHVQLESDSESSDSSDDDEQNVQTTVLWHVAPDFGELDPNVVGREKDIKNGEKESGWTNPLGWTDDGHDDDLVVLQLRQKMRFDESGFDTPADKGLGDEMVVNLLQTHDEDDAANVETDSQMEAAERVASTSMNTVSTYDDGVGDDRVM
eukprot:CAMPEP_0170492738 /NCGR_PEP_ID=MMETSP0208-20121228/12752_1 /TAXON_ID=197538 /ORGANISM="Strombidium inclinatum, Strain S3" /LENGTH=249 /DNA_ID=CAMNT_0010768529 /DNA_START=17 /DNA_END=766 /DNA_ORIENTATION=+